MDDARVGTAFRTVRIRHGWTQAIVAERAGVARATVSRIECGHLEPIPMSTMRKVARALGMYLDVVPRWRGTDLDRLLHLAHNALHESVARHFLTLPHWITVPEVSYSIYGERGVIDIVAWHESSRSLLIIELKSLLVDAGELVGSMDRRVRLGRSIALERGWAPTSVSAWVILTDTRTNRRHVQRQETMLRTPFPDGGRRMRSWLLAPHGRVTALSFVSNDHAVIARRVATKGPNRARARPSTRAASPARGA